MTADELMAERKKRAWDRRLALNSAGVTTYEVNVIPMMFTSTRIQGSRACQIICMCCGRTSSNFSDIELKYCGFCRAYHEENYPYVPG